MNEDNDDSGISVAFVDVITNGLGGMLVLFLVMLLMETTLDWADGRAGLAGSPEASNSAFVIFVHSDQSAPLFANDTKPWVFENLPDDPGILPRGRRWDWGMTHAIYLASSAPPPGGSVRLKVQTQGTVESGNDDFPVIEIIYRDSHISRKLPKPDTNGLVCVWPITEQ